MSSKLILLAGLAAALLTGTLRAADQPNPAEARMRETLRNTMLQLRTAQTDAATLQSAKAELEKNNKELETKVELLTKNGVKDRDEAKNTIQKLTTKLEEQASALEQLKRELEKLQADYKAATTLAQSKETARKTLEEEKIILDRTVADQKTKNAELYKLGREILLRYEKFGLGEALGAKEPFVGTKRVQLETYIQDFQDKLTDQKFKPATH